jgi:hypothetical protein
MKRRMAECGVAHHKVERLLLKRYAIKVADYEMHIVLPLLSPAFVCQSDHHWRNVNAHHTIYTLCQKQ